MIMIVDDNLGLSSKMKDLKYCIPSIQLFVFSAQAGGRGEIVGVYVPWLHLASQGACQGTILEKRPKLEQHISFSFRIVIVLGGVKNTCKG